MSGIESGASPIDGPQDTAEKRTPQTHRGPDNPAARFGASMAPRASAKTLQARLIRKERENLERVFASFETEESVARAAALIAGARRRFIVGHGRSAAFAHLLDLDLSHGLSQVSLIDGQSTRSIDVLTDVRGTDVLVAFSLRRYRRETAELVRAFAQRGGTVVAVTDSTESPLVEPATELVIVPTDSASVTDSATGIAAVIHLLTALTTTSAKGSRRRLTERESLIQEMGLYI
ncbi:MurR/RpiR family transcriptional regulator [Nesterenkonia sp. E16_7]|uniref:MurR/RpiR family transcriptional regulator n=1 Tax=unclassified Nesterenkonia TaxID=2629769 RepID=UPI001A912C6D|nr:MULTISPECIES: SIS domain-containing protein [unclassified Nesterenkonia]MBO0597017.1 MurR/RpiR family transcriptional regulator [Nesterenkonia sp. E16_10]MBO0599906.1 MurR/RpiR family transcriptional regulator [Nesterenkonia sp. E16_7]